MDNNEILENKGIKIYWWNYRKKTLEYEGNYKGYFLEKKIEIQEITHPKNPEIKGLRFKINVSNSNITLDSFDSNKTNAYNEAIIIYLTLLGDKAKFTTSYREYLINWSR